MGKSYREAAPLQASSHAKMFQDDGCPVFWRETEAEAESRISLTFFVNCHVSFAVVKRKLQNWADDLVNPTYVTNSFVCPFVI